MGIVLLSTNLYFETKFFTMECVRKFWLSLREHLESQVSRIESPALPPSVEGSVLLYSDSPTTWLTSPLSS